VGDNAEVRALTKYVTATVVEGHERTTRQCCKRRLRNESLVELLNQVADIGLAADATGQWRLKNVAHAVVARGGNQLLFFCSISERAGIGDATDLNIAAGSEVNIAVAEILGQIGEYGKARRGEEASGEAQATNCAISCDMNLSGAGATVLTSASSLIRCSHTLKNTQTSTELSPENRGSLSGPFQPNETILKWSFDSPVQKTSKFFTKSTDFLFQILIISIT